MNEYDNVIELFPSTQQHNIWIDSMNALNEVVYSKIKLNLFDCDLL